MEVWENRNGIEKRESGLREHGRVATVVVIDQFGAYHTIHPIRQLPDSSSPKVQELLTAPVGGSAVAVFRYGCVNALSTVKRVSGSKSSNLSIKSKNSLLCDVVGGMIWTRDFIDLTYFRDERPTVLFG
jgi:hypothetical protein